MRFIINATTREDGLVYIILLLMYNTHRYELRPADQGGLRRVGPFTRVSQKQNLEKKKRKHARSPRDAGVGLSGRVGLARAYGHHHPDETTESASRV